MIPQISLKVCIGSWRNLISVLTGIVDVPYVESVNTAYVRNILTYHGLTTEPIDRLYKIRGFDDYNSLLDINSVFSNNINYWPIDRTYTVQMPFKWSMRRSWALPTAPLDLSEAMAARVAEIAALNQMINIYWSGGIDSTAIVTAFLQHHHDLSQIRVIYSPWSCYEHPHYLDFLRQFPQIELLDQSGEIYLNLQLDGVSVLGHSGDEIHASMDQSFLSSYGYGILSTPWQDFFWSRRQDQKFMDFCERFFTQAGGLIRTVLHARWWFYATCKISSILRETSLPTLLTGTNRCQDILGFFDCDSYERYIFYNQDQIMPRDDYASWKGMLKQYCNQFDHLDDWCVNKTKFHSRQFDLYGRKKDILRDQRWIMLLDDGSKITTANLPFLSEAEWRSSYGSSLDNLINDPDQK